MSASQVHERNPSPRGTGKDAVSPGSLHYGSRRGVYLHTEGVEGVRAAKQNTKAERRGANIYWHAAKF